MRNLKTKIKCPSVFLKIHDTDLLTPCICISFYQNSLMIIADFGNIGKLTYFDLVLEYRSQQNDLVLTNKYLHTFHGI